MSIGALEAVVTIGGTQYPVESIKRTNILENLTKNSIEIVLASTVDVSGIMPWDTLTVTEQGVRTWTGFVDVVKVLRAPPKKVILGKETFKRAIDYYISDDWKADNETYRYWIDKICSACGIGYVIDEPSSGSYSVGVMAQMGKMRASDALIRVIQNAGWHLREDCTSGSLHFLSITSPSAADYSLDPMEWERELNDEYLRNTVKIYGYSSGSNSSGSGGKIFYKQSIEIENYPQERAVLVDDSLITTDSQAQDLAQQIIDQCGTVVSQVTARVIGNPGVRVGQFALIPGVEDGGKIVTDLETTLDRGGYEQQVTLGRKSIRIPDLPLGEPKLVVATTTNHVRLTRTFPEVSPYWEEVGTFSGIVDMELDPLDGTGNTLYLLTETTLYRTKDLLTNANWDIMVDIADFYSAEQLPVFSRLGLSKSGTRCIQILGYGELTAGSSQTDQSVFRSVSNYPFTQYKTGTTFAPGSESTVFGVGSHNPERVYASGSGTSGSLPDGAIGTVTYAGAMGTWASNPTGILVAPSIRDYSGTFVGYNFNTSWTPSTQPFFTFTSDLDYLVIDRGSPYVYALTQVWVRQAGFSRMRVDGSNDLVTWSDPYYTWGVSNELYTRPVGSTFSSSYRYLRISFIEGTAYPVESMAAWGVEPGTTAYLWNVVPAPPENPPYSVNTIGAGVGLGIIRSAENITQPMSFASYVNLGARDLAVYRNSNPYDNNLIFIGQDGVLYRTSGSSQIAIDTAETGGTMIPYRCSKPYDSAAFWFKATGSDSYVIRRLLHNNTTTWYAEDGVAVTGARSLTLLPNVIASVTTQKIYFLDSGHVRYSADGGQTMVDKTGNWDVFENPVRIIPIIP
jgi:hypothetical protein